MVSEQDQTFKPLIWSTLTQAILIMSHLPYTIILIAWGVIIVPSLGTMMISYREGLSHQTDSYGNFKTATKTLVTVNHYIQVQLHHTWTISTTSPLKRTIWSTKTTLLISLNNITTTSIKNIRSTITRNSVRN